MNIEEQSSREDFSGELIIQALGCSPEATAIYTDEDMIIRFANEGMLEVWGKNASVIGKPLMKALPELEGQPFLGLLQQVWRSGQTYSVSDAPVNVIKNGISTTDYYDYEYKALLNKEGRTWCILNTARKVSSRREYLERIQRKEEKEQSLMEEMAATMEELSSTNEDLNTSLKLLGESREHIRTIIEQAPVGIAMLQGPEHIIEIANPAILKIWGRSLPEVEGLPHEKARPELIGQPVNRWLNEVFTTGQRRINNEFTVRLRDHDGLREAIVNSIYQPVFSSDGLVSGVLVILEEITQLVLDRRASEKDQQMLLLAVEAGDLATFFYEPKTNLFSGNALLKSWFGLPEAQTIDLSVAFSSILDEDRARVEEAIMESLSATSNGNYFIEYRIYNLEDPNGRLVQARGKVFYDNNGNVISLNGTLRDITEQKKDEQRKDDFMAMVSHELKTPLTSLNAYQQLMQRNAMLSGDQKLEGILEKSLRQVRNMTSMINGFLNISRLDSGKMLLAQSYFDLKALFYELEDEVHSTVHTHRIVFEKNESVDLYADRDKISQVIHNLIGNAVKYSPIGSEINISYSKPENGKVAIVVKDDGMGIDEQDQQQIFERYYRIKSPNMGSIAGFGIGLYLCKEIIELHKGEIKLESREGAGATFIVELPV
ncbi:PAS domain-containing sensor histidine kinase [Pedobacter sp. MC2016-05]|uniref:PAS domain-containing sensor histidine kinase n=1 Tax=Pedobacter sp. MC2016-05 TaxID=2994474 RepID=UPI0022477CDA|nr:PAS domain-containing sensor histidine kinase [Pedobacter sp. MC2016-05]MCX2473882.1 PAS domain-containing sensor histidine kinase [Pedobacter sp. MC2016-05]